jgi:hypothetical protein
MTEATQKRQSRATTPQSRAKVLQLREAQAGKLTRAKVLRLEQAAKTESGEFLKDRFPQSRAEFLKGWKSLEKFLRKDYKEMCNTKKDSFQLLRVIESRQRQVQGVEAEVNWYTGGNSYVTLPTAVAANGFQGPGFYLAMTKWVRMKDVPEEDWGPKTPVASITDLRWKGTTWYFKEIAFSRRVLKALGKKKYNRLMEMLGVGVE